MSSSIPVSPDLILPSQLASASAGDLSQSTLELSADSEFGSSIIGSASDSETDGIGSFESLLVASAPINAPPEALPQALTFNTEQALASVDGPQTADADYQLANGVQGKVISSRLAISGIDTVLTQSVNVIGHRPNAPGDAIGSQGSRPGSHAANQLNINLPVQTELKIQSNSNGKTNSKQSGTYQATPQHGLSYKTAEPSDRSDTAQILLPNSESTISAGNVTSLPQFFDTDSNPIDLDFQAASFPGEATATGKFNVVEGEAIIGPANTIEAASPRATQHQINSLNELTAAGYGREIVRQATTIIETELPGLRLPAKQTFTADINPPELGRMSIQVDVTTDRIAAQIVVSEWVSAEMLIREKDALQASFANLGFDESQVDISHGSMSDDPDSPVDQDEREHPTGIEIPGQSAAQRETTRIASGLNLIA